MHKYPYPDDFDFSIKLSTRAYYCMFKNKMTGYPKSEISGKYIKFNSTTDCFNLYATRAESFSKYGLEHSIQKRKETCMKRYGVEHASQSNEVIENRRKHNNEKYGVDSYFQTKEFREKRKKWSREKFGTDDPMQSEELKEKRK